MDKPPIEVSASAGGAQFATAIRYFLMGLGAFATGLGFEASSGSIEQLASYAGPVGAAIAFVWGQYSSRRSAKLKATLAEAAPNSVAVVK